MPLIKSEAFQITLDKELFEDWINRDAREREVISNYETMKINSLEIVNGDVVLIVVDLHEEYLN